MYMQIRNHSAYIEDKLTKQLTSADKKVLLKYHIRRVRDFQHERFIHLLVTLFFGILLMTVFICWIALPLPSLFWPLSSLLAILLILEIAYIRHYYLLENGVQSLYDLTEKLGK